jgi:hypothetical protein
MFVLCHTLNVCLFVLLVWNKIQLALAHVIRLLKQATSNVCARDA